MKSLNTKNRAVSFIQFLLLFIVSTGFILLAVFYSIRTRADENVILREQIGEHIEQDTLLVSYTRKVTAIYKGLDSLKRNKKDGVDIKLIEDQLVKLTTASNDAPKTVNSPLYTVINQSLFRISRDIKDFRAYHEDKSKLEEEIAKLNEKIKEKEEDINELRRDNDRLESALTGLE